MAIYFLCKYCGEYKLDSENSENYKKSLCVDCFIEAEIQRINDECIFIDDYDF